jgi:hypothetical protein
MPLFEPYTQNILLEATRRKRTTTRVTKSPSGGGGGGGGSMGVTGSAGAMNTPWAGTPVAPGTQMPDISIPTQATWGSISKMADSYIDHYLNKTNVLGNVVGGVVGAVAPGKGAAAQAAATAIGTDPAVKFGVKQGVKTILAQQYLGSPSGQIGDIPSIIGGAISQGVHGIPPSKPSSGSRFGILGDKVSGKVGSLAAMGIDPLDWVTNAFGAQSALSQISGIGSQTANAAVGAGGYLERGKRKGIY